MKPLASVVLAVGLICSSCLPSARAFGDTVVADGDFADWSADVVSDGSGSGEWYLHASGGNPGAFLEIGISTPIHVTTYVLMWKNDFVWDPAVDGAILSVAFQLDERAMDSSWAGQRIKGLVVQDGTYYGGPLVPWDQHVTGTSESWETMVFDPIPAGNFGEIPPCEEFNSESTPDFSCSGPPMRFGFMVGNTYIENPRYHGYDNWQVTIVSAGPSSVELGAWGRIKAIYR